MLPGEVTHLIRLTKGDAASVGRTAPLGFRLRHLIPQWLCDSQFYSALARPGLPGCFGSCGFERHFVAPVPPRFTNFLASEIRAKVFDGGIVRTEGRPGTIAGLSFLEPS